MGRGGGMGREMILLRGHLFTSPREPNHARMLKVRVDWMKQLWNDWVLTCLLAAVITSGESTGVVDFLKTRSVLLLKVSLRSMMESRSLYSSSLSIIWLSNWRAGVRVPEIYDHLFFFLRCSRWDGYPWERSRPPHTAVAALSWYPRWLCCVPLKAVRVLTMWHDLQV